MLRQTQILKTKHTLQEECVNQRAVLTKEKKKHYFTEETNINKKWEEVYSSREVKERLEKNKREKEALLKVAKKVAVEVEADIPRLETMNDDFLQSVTNFRNGRGEFFTPEQINAQRDRIQEFEAKFTPQGQFGFLASYWEKFVGTSPIPEESFGEDWNKNFPSFRPGGLRTPLSGHTREEWVE